MKLHSEHRSSRSVPERFTTSGLRLASAVSLAILMTGCAGESNRKLFQRYEAQFSAKREQFKKIAGILPPAGSVKEASSASLSPKPVYDAKNSASNNTEIVMYDQLLDPDISSDGNNRRLDLLLSDVLLNAIRWTGPKNPMSGSALDRHNPDMEQTLKQALNERYLVVIRPVSFVAPVAIDEGTFKPATADIEGFVVDLSGDKVVGSFRFSAHSASTVQYTTKKSDNSATRQSQLEEFAYSSLYVEARNKLKPLLEQTTGGSFTLER